MGGTLGDQEGRTKKRRMESELGVLAVVREELTSLMASSTSGW